MLRVSGATNTPPRRRDTMTITTTTADLAFSRPTFDQVAALRYDAIDHGDLELAAACHIAIEDDDDAAWEAVTAALKYAAGQV